MQAFSHSAAQRSPRNRSAERANKKAKAVQLDGVYVLKTDRQDLSADEI